jgi:hypothetical protein
LCNISRSLLGIASEQGVLIDLQTKGAADLGVIPSQSTIIIPLMQDNKLVDYKLVAARVGAE